jgi:hypothetical protein
MALPGDDGGNKNLLYFLNSHSNNVRIALNSRQVTMGK